MGFTIDLGWLLSIIPEIPPDLRAWIGAILIFIVLIMLIPGIIAYLIFVIIGISGFKRLFSYERRQSIIHRMHPLPKIIYVFTVSYVSYLSDNPVVLVILLIITIFPWTLANPSKDKIRLVTIMLLIQFLMTAWSQSFLNPYYTTPAYTWVYSMPEALHWMSRSISLEGAQYGMVQSLRIMAALSAALLLVTTTHPSDIVYGLRTLKFPYEIVFMVSVTIKSIPALIEKIFLVIAAEQARGLSLIPRISANPISVLKGIGHAFKALIVAFIPAIVEAMREARRMAIAATVKAFRAYPNRTEYLEWHLALSDKILLIIMLLVDIIVFINQVFIPIIPL